MRESLPFVPRNGWGMIRRTSFIGSIIAFFAGCARKVGSTSASTGMMGGSAMNGGGMMGGGGMMNVSGSDMSVYMEMFDHHTEIRRRVEDLPNGIRTITESDNPRLAALLHEHVPSMWAHVNEGKEVHCMSNSLPTMFRNASKYQRRLELTRTGVVVTETTSDPAVLAALRAHADEVSGFVRDGMSAMMRGMMQH